MSWAVNNYFSCSWTISILQMSEFILQNKSLQEIIKLSLCSFSLASNIGNSNDWFYTYYMFFLGQARE